MECGFDTHKNALINNLVILFDFLCAVESIYSFFQTDRFFWFNIYYTLSKVSGFAGWNLRQRQSLHAYGPILRTFQTTHSIMRVCMHACGYLIICACGYVCLRVCVRAYIDRYASCRCPSEPECRAAVRSKVDSADAAAGPHLLFRRIFHKSFINRRLCRITAGEFFVVRTRDRKFSFIVRTSEVGFADDERRLSVVFKRICCCSCPGPAAAAAPCCCCCCCPLLLLPLPLPRPCCSCLCCCPHFSCSSSRFKADEADGLMNSTAVAAPVLLLSPTLLLPPDDD